MNNADLINEILLGGLLGLLGQGIRIVVGLKKLHTSNTAKTINDEPTDEFDSSRLLLSLFIGFLAGALALILKGTLLSTTLGNEDIMPIMAAGYTGADFIEGVFNTYGSKINTGKADPNKADPNKADTNGPQLDKQQLLVNDESKKV